MTDLQQRFQTVLSRIAEACKRVGRDPARVTLVAVSKTHPPESVEALSRLGQIFFGENKVQEAARKIPECSGRLRWHMIGHLQTNKARDAVRLFEMVHSVDSLRLAMELEKQAALQSRRLQILLEVNVSGEGAKFGFKPEETPEASIKINMLPHLELRGLMTMPPFLEEPELSRPFFRGLKELKVRVEQKLGASLPDLSMGMSGDYEVAIEEGATLVRVGTALFGPRLSRRKRESGTIDGEAGQPTEG